MQTLEVSQRVEQGTPHGVLAFNPGTKYAVTDVAADPANGRYVPAVNITHEPREERREGRRVVVTSTLVDRGVLAKLVALYGTLTAYIEE